MPHLRCWTLLPILYCGGKRSATPLSYARKASEHLGRPRALESAVAAALGRRSTNRGSARTGEAFFRPAGTGGGGAADDPAMNGWAIFTNTSRSSARSTERRRAEARRAGIFVDCRRENDFSSVGARYAAPDGAGMVNGSGTLQRCRAYGAGHLIPHFVLRWQAERDTAFVRTKGSRTFERPRALASAVAAALCRRSTNRERPGRERRSFVPPGFAGLGRRMTQP